AEIGRPREVIGAGEAGIEAKACLAGAAAELRAQDVEHERLRRRKALRQWQVAGALAHPGFWRGLTDRVDKAVAYLRKELHMLMAVDEIGRSSERFREGCQLRLYLIAKELAVEPSRKARAQQLWKG